MPNTPLITVGIVAYNRAWIIDKMLASLQSQTYPHSSLHVVFVDGESKDATAQQAKNILAHSDFGGYEVIVEKCNIPEGRNICIHRMQGELLFFWDSDVIMPPYTLAKLVASIEKENADVMTTTVNNITVASIAEVESKLEENSQTGQQTPYAIKVAMMGQTLLKKRLLDTVRFDEQLTIQEDADFCLRARELGFKIMREPNVVSLDVNMYNVAYSDICIDMTLNDAMKGIRRKSQVQVYVYHFQSGWRNNFFWQYKRYVFYLLYLPTIALTVAGILLQNLLLALVFPAYALFYTAMQIRRRGVARGVRAFVLSLLVGIPNAFWVTIYWIKIKVQKPKK
jgi:glycosyltransferase involved in cell wall biosynthesis